MLYGVDVNQRVEFVSSRDLDDPKTVFVLRPATGMESALLGDTLKTLFACIVEIRNMPNTTDKESYINSLDLISFTELCNKVNELNRVTPGERKN